MAEVPRFPELYSNSGLRQTTASGNGPTRRAFLGKAAAVGVAGGAVIGGVGTFAFAQSGAASQDALDDLEILNFALVLEFLEARFYEQAVDKAGLDGELQTYAETLRDHELAHVDALTAAIKEGGGTPVAEPEFDFGKAVRDPDTFIKTSVTLEETGVGAYQGAAPSLESTEYLKAAASILPVEAFHTAWGRTLSDGGEKPAPVAFNEALTVQQVLDRVGDTGFITSELPAAITGAAQSATPSTTG